MKPIFTILLALAISGDAFAQSDKGLIGYWNFEEGQGQTTRDASGNGHDGQIRGGAKWVQGRKGMALEFNGKDSSVELANGKSLNISGDATFMAWVKTTSEHARDQLIFGDTSSGGVDRNLGVELDYGALLVCHGNGAQSSNIGPHVDFDGTWKHLTIVFEEPKYYFYVNGVLAEVGDLTLPLTHTRGENWGIGGWWAGYFRGVIDEVRYYSRALSEREILEQTGAGPTPLNEAAIRLSPRFNTDSLAFSAWFPRLTDKDGTVACTLTRKDAREPSRRFTASLKPTRPDSERCFAEAATPLPGLSPGDYVIAVDIRDAAGASTGSFERDATIPVRPAWIGSEAGKTDAVLPPYTPVEVKKDAEDVLVNVSGRSYRLGSGPLPKQIVSREENLLQGPVRLLATVDGKPVSWSAAAPTVQEQTPAKVAIGQSASAGSLTLQSDAIVEYDGFLRTNCVLTSASPASIDSLVLEIPLRKECAKYLYSWPSVAWTGADGSRVNTGQIRQAAEATFHPIVWIGDDLRGLSWFCESENQFLPADPDKVMQVVPGDDQVTLRIRIIGKPATLAADQPLKYTFAFQATPLKPIEKDCWDYRFGSSPWYGEDYDLLTDRKFLGKSGPACMKQFGIRTVTAWNWTPALAYPWPLERAADFKKFVEACHAEGMKVTPYFGMQISDKATEAPAVKDEVVVHPTISGPDKYPGEKPQIVTFVCLHSYWKDALAHYASRLVDEFDIDGLYLDTTCAPFGCTNALHGCSAHRLDGTQVPFYPVFDVRDLFRRLYTIVKSKKPDGILDSHVYDCMNSGTLAYATSYWTGEQMGTGATVTDTLPLDRFRTEFMGVNWGVPCDLLAYRLGGFVKASALSLPHDVMVRYRHDEVPVDSGETEHLMSQALWKLMDDFGRRESQFTPYYAGACPLAGLPESWIASVYRHPKNGALVILSNLGQRPERAELVPDWKSLGLDGPGPIVDGLSRKPVSLVDGKVEMELPVNGWQYLWFQRASPKK